MFTLVLSTGQMAGAIAAIGVLLLGVYKYIIRPAQKVVKVYNSVGSNGKGPKSGETVFQLLHGINGKLGDLQTWQTRVDDTLNYQNVTLIHQNNEIAALAVSMDVLLERYDKP